MGTDKNKQLVIRLIRQDLKHNQLVYGLEGLGFADKGLHGLEILEIIAELMEVPEEKITGAWIGTYIEFLERSTDYKITGNGTNLLPLAEECYNVLLARLDNEGQKRSENA